jgi:flavodoxin
MNILIAYFSQTGNTAKVAQAIYKETSSQGHKVDLKDRRAHIKQSGCLRLDLFRFRLSRYGSGKTSQASPGGDCRLATVQVGRLCHPRIIYA